MKWLNDPRILRIALVAVSLLAVLFLILWAAGGTRNDGLDRLCSDSAAKAAGFLRSYSETDDLDACMDGLDAFYVFLEAWLAAEGRSDPHQNCTDIYRAICSDRTLLDENLQDVISLLEDLSKDIRGTYGELERLQLLLN